MNQDESFLRSIQQSPDDDSARLVYADWLEERGDPRAEFIRIQCARARMAPDDEGLVQLRARETELLAKNAKDWCAPLGLEPDQCQFRRGFVEALEIHADRFLEDHERLFEVAPICQIHFLYATKRIRDLANCPSIARLATLDLSANAIRDDGIASLAASPYLSGLTTLDLGGCEIHEQSGQTLAAAKALSGLRSLCLANCGICLSGLQAIMQSSFLKGVRTLDVRGNHQCWVTPNRGEAWVTLTETNIKNEGVCFLAQCPETARLESVDLSLNLIESSGWEAILNSPHLAGVQSLTVFETNHVYADEGPGESPTTDSAQPINEVISDVLCISIPGGRRRQIPRYPGDPRYTAPPNTIDQNIVQRLQNRFGHRVKVTPPRVRFGAHFDGAREDWYGYRAVLDSSAK
jgi:uncharacterized protein (TIGR02996 family)